ncbi:MAG: hypothetical protein LBI17_03175 [Rickettsiales bacterium]|jgi:hypothetical protein|nr:hypothetical protein [Rickettsiales bacterium]
MDSARTLWVKNPIYGDVEEFHFVHPEMSFVAYFKSGRLIFVIDGTNDALSPNDILVIEPLPGEPDPAHPATKWDAILKAEYGIDPLKIRPKKDTKFKKLDVSYAGLDLYASFVSLMGEELFATLFDAKRVFALENAYQREAEDLLVYNKAARTLEKADVTLANLKRKIVNLSKRLQRREAADAARPDSADEAKKAELTQKLYDATEKLKRTERRIRRAKKRFDSAESDLASKREQIRALRRIIDARGAEMDVEEQANSRQTAGYVDAIRREQAAPPADSAALVSMPPASAPAAVPHGKTERLTIPAEDAKNQRRTEEKGLNKENTMAKDTDKTAQEFKPPFVDDTAQPKSDIRFAKKTGVPLDDRYRKIWMYSLSVIVSLAIVFVVFYLISGSDGPEDYSQNYVEQRIAEPVEPQPYEPEPVYYEGGESIEYEPHPEPQAYVPEEWSAPKPAVVEQPKKSAVYSKPVRKPAKPVAAKPAPVVPLAATREERVESVDKDAENARWERIKQGFDEGLESINKGVEIYNQHKRAKAAAALDAVRGDYVANVIDGDRYVNLVGAVKYNFYNDDDNSALEEIEDMNRYWNAFRNAVYDEYYEDDYVLKADMDYDAYAEDERLLRVYTDVYYDFFEYLANEFVMTYEYANGTALDMYSQIESGLQALGHPVAKLNLLVELYNIIQIQGGTAAVLEAIYVKDAEAEKNAEQEVGLVVLDTSTEITVRDNLTGDEQKYNLVETVEHDIFDASESAVVYNEPYPSDMAAEIAPGDFADDEVAAARDESSGEEESASMSEDEVEIEIYDEAGESYAADEFAPVEEYPDSGEDDSSYAEAEAGEEERDEIGESAGEYVVEDDEEYLEVSYN